MASFSKGLATPGWLLDMALAAGVMQFGPLPAALLPGCVADRERRAQEIAMAAARGWLRPSEWSPPLNPALAPRTQARRACSSHPSW